MRTPVLALGLLFRLLVPTSSLAQEVEAGPGDVVTVPVPVPATLLETAGGAVAYAVSAPPGAIVIGRRAGTFSWVEGDPQLLPLTIRVPETARSGPLIGLAITFAVEGSESRTVPVLIRVRAAHELTVTLVSTSEAVARGEMAAFRYSISNRGNAPDSVRLEVAADGMGIPDALPGIIWLEPFGEHEGEFRLPVPSTAPVGKSEYVRLTATGSGARSADHATYVVTAEPGLFPGLVQIPTTVFLGSTLSTDGRATRTSPVLSVEGGGAVGRQTEVLFSYRLQPEGNIGYAFRGLFAAPGLYVAVRRPSWEAAGGDLNPQISPLLGYSYQSRGLSGTWRAGRVSLHAIGGRPLAPNGGVSAGHVAAAEMGYQLPVARAALLVSSTERQSTVTVQSSVRAALLRVDGELADHTFGFDAGPMRIEDRTTGEVEQGPSVAARYAYRKDARTLDLRALLLPRLAADPRLPSSQVRAAGALPVSRTVIARASAFTEEAAPVSYLEGSRITGGEAGLRLGPSAWSAGIALVGREVTGRNEGGRRNVRLDGSTRIGTLGLDATAAFGESRLADVAGFFQTYRVGASLRGSRTSLNANLTFTDDLLQPASFLVDVAGTYRLTERIETFGVVTSFHDRILDGVPLRTLTDDLTVRLGTAIDLGRSLKAYVGVERLPSGGGPGGEWRFSVGVRQGVPLPLPVPRPPAVSGVIYEDVDGDGVRGEHDLLLDGATLRMGFERAVSRPGGRFAFENADPTTIIVETRNLGPNYLPMPEIPVPDDRYLEIGVTRAANLRVSVFFDSNGNGAWDAGELAAGGLEIVVRREGDEAWEIVTGADGSAVLGSVRPGSFTLAVNGESLPRRALSPELQTVSVPGGQEALVRIAIPMREINFTEFGDPVASCDELTAVCDD